MTMLAGPSLLWAHVPKNAGSYVTRLLMRWGLADWDTVQRFVRLDHNSHQGLRVIPERHRAPRLCLATVRSPWERYVSAAHYWLGQDGRAGEFVAQFVDGAEVGDVVPIPDIIWGMLEPPDRVAWTIPYPPHRSETLGEELRRRDVGLCTWTQELICADAAGSWLADALVDVGQVGAGLPAVLDRAGLWQPAWLADVLSEPAANVNGRYDSAQWRSYYTPELAALVAHKDRRIVDLMGYRLDGPPSRAVWWGGAYR